MGFAKAVWRFGVYSKNFGAASKRILYYMTQHVRSSTKGGRNEGQDKKKKSQLYTNRDLLTTIPHEGHHGPFRQVVCILSVVLALAILPPSPFRSPQKASAK